MAIICPRLSLPRGRALLQPPTLKGVNWLGDSNDVTNALVWTPSNVGSSIPGLADPWGGTTARYTPIQGGAGSQGSNRFVTWGGSAVPQTVVPGQWYVFSMYQRSDPAYGGGLGPKFSFLMGDITNSVKYYSADITATATWQRYWQAWQAPAGCVSMGVGWTNDAAGDGSRNITCAFQFEPGTVPTPYTPRP